MNTAAHTPGPWAEHDWRVTGPTAAFDLTVIEEVKKLIPEVFARPVAQARGVGMVVVCTVYGMSEEEVRANACLIAAAPELLEYFNASTAFAAICGSDGATVEDERKAEERFDAALVAARAKLAGAK